MSNEQEPDDLEQRLSSYFEKRKQPSQVATMATPLSPTAMAAAPAQSRLTTAVSSDGRLSTAVDRGGKAQLNVRVPAEIKERLLELRAKRKREGSKHSDLSDIVVEALQLLLLK